MIETLCEGLNGFGLNTEMPTALLLVVFMATALEVL